MKIPAPTSLALRLRDGVWFFGVSLCALQWIIVSQRHLALPVAWAAILPGLAIFGAAFLLSWGAELAELEISQSLALAFLALMAVLPEYAVDMYLAWTAAKDPTYTAYAAANMTGANRILIGLGWPVILLCYWAKTRQRSIQLEAGQRVELAALFVATFYAFLIPLKRSLSLFDTVVLLAIFVVYIVQSGKATHVEPEFSGPPVHLALLPRTWRRLVTIALFLIPGYTIFLAAEPFADGLLHSARHLGVEEFVLIQWVAPLASESPEFIIAILFALRRNAKAGFGALVSSKVNQWTLLVGMLPLVYAISGGHLGAMHLDGRQTEEIFLTVAQSLLGVIILANGRFSIGEALLLAGLFVTQLLTPVTWIRTVYAGVYVLLSLGYLLNRPYRRAIIELCCRGWSRPPSG